MTPRAGRDGTASCRLVMLGGFALSVDATPVDVSLDAQRLLCFLAVHRRPLVRAFVAGSLWGRASEDRAGGSLRTALWRLRQPDVSFVSLTSDRIALSPAVTVDLREGEALARKVLDPSQDLDDIVEANEEVLSADLLPDWTEDWVLMERERYHQLRLRALEALCRRLIAAGRVGQAVQAGLAAAAGEPLRESGRKVLIEAYLAEHNIAAARREYAAFRELLRAELNVEPSPDLTALIEGLT